MNDRDLDDLTGFLEAHALLELRDGLDRLPIDGDDDIAFLNPGALSRGIVTGELVHHDAADFLEPDFFRILRRNRPDLDTHHRPLDVPRGNQLRHHGAGEVDRDCKPVAGIKPGLTGDGRIDADDLATHVDERPPRVAGVDGRVGLNEVLNRIPAAIEAGEQPPLRTHDPSGDSKCECFAERIANGEHPVADLGRVGIAEPHGRQPGRLNLDDCDVGRWIGTDGLGGEFAVVVQANRDAVGALHDVVVRQDVSVLGHDEARPRSLLDLGTARDLEEIVKSRRQAPVAHMLAPLRLDEYDRGLHMLGNRCERVAEIDGSLCLRKWSARVLKHRAHRCFTACRQLE